MSSQIIEEFIQALDEEIQAIKRGRGGSVVKVFNGQFLRDVAVTSPPETEPLLMRGSCG